MRAIHHYIANDSVQQADKVLDAIEAIVDKLPAQPTHYTPDKFRRINDGTYRAFIKYDCRAAYRAPRSQLRIILVRHTRRTPFYY